MKPAEPRRSETRVDRWLAGMEPPPAAMIGGATVLFCCVWLAGCLWQRHLWGEPFLRHVGWAETNPAQINPFAGRWRPNANAFRVDAVWTTYAYGFCLLGLLALLETRVSALGFAREWRRASAPKNPWARALFEPAEGRRRWRRFVALAIGWTIAPASLLAMMWESIGPTPREAWFSTGETLLGSVATVVCGFAMLAPAIGHHARARLRPMFAECLASPMRTPDFAAPMRRTILEGVFAANRVAIVMWVCVANTRLTRWESSVPYWAEHPDVLLFGLATLFAWSANYAAGFYLRATMAATLPLFHRSALAAIAGLNLAAAGSFLLRGWLLVLLFQSGWRPRFLPEAIEGPDGGLNLVLIASAFEGILCGCRLAAGRWLWRRLESRPPATAFPEG